MSFQWSPPNGVMQTDLFLPTKICDNTHCTEYCQPDKLTLALAIRVFPGARSCSYGRQPYCVTQGSQNKSLSHRRLFVVAGFSGCSARKLHSHLSSVSGGHLQVFACIPSSSLRARHSLLCFHHHNTFSCDPYPSRVSVTRFLT